MKRKTGLVHLNNKVVKIKDNNHNNNITEQQECKYVNDSNKNSSVV